MDPGAQLRLFEIISNLNDRIAEAKLNGWLGEVASLQVSLDAAARKLTTAWTGCATGNPPARSTYASP